MSTIGDLPVFPNTYGAGQWSWQEKKYMECKVESDWCVHAITQFMYATKFLSNNSPFRKPPICDRYHVGTNAAI
jgi:hypothetical protein